MWLYYFLIFYILTVGLLLNQKYKYNRMLALLMTLGLLAFLTIFRSENVGNDTHAYVSLFNWIKHSGSLASLSSRYEIGFLYLNLILARFFDDVQVVFIVSGLYVYLSFGYIIYKKSKMIWLSVLLFFTLRYFDLGMSGLRQILAIATILNSYHFIIKRKPVKFTLLVFLAYSFHNTAIVFLPAYLLTKVKFSKRFVFVMSGISLFIFIMFDPLLNILLSIYPRYTSYLESTYLDGQLRSFTIIQSLFALMILIIGELSHYKLKNPLKIENKHVDNSVKNTEENILSIFMLISILILFISIRGVIFNRFYNIFAAFSIIYVPNTVKKVCNSRLKILILYTIMILFIMYSTSVQLYRPEWQSSYPYEFFWRIKQIWFIN